MARRKRKRRGRPPKYADRRAVLVCLERDQLASIDAAAAREKRTRTDFIVSAALIAAMASAGGDADRRLPLRNGDVLR